MDSTYYSPQSPPPWDVSPRSGSGGRGSEAKWGQGGRRAMQVSGHPAGGLRRMAGAPPGRPCVARGGGRALDQLGGEGEGESGRGGWGGDADGAEPDRRGCER